MSAEEECGRESERERGKESKEREECVNECEMC